MGVVKKLTGYRLAGDLDDEIERHALAVDSIRDQARERKATVDDAIAQLQHETVVLGNVLSTPALNAA